jgi:hypothetical protein
MDLDGDNDNNEGNNNYDNNSLDGNNDDNHQEEPEEAHASPDDKSLYWDHLLAGVVCTNQDYGLGHMVLLPNTSANTLAMFEAVEL